MKQPESFAFSLPVVLAFALVVGTLALVPSSIVAFVLTLAFRTMPPSAAIGIAGATYILTTASGLVWLCLVRRRQSP